MNKDREMNRGDFLKASGATFLVTASLASCDLLSTEPEGKDDRGGSGPSGTGRKSKEAPQLAEMVKQGELPPVEKRLPKNPLMLEPIERMGSYGGQWDSNFSGGLGTFIRDFGYEYLVRWKRDVEAFAPDEVIPNVAESFEASDDGTEYTFHLREGMRWSDGEPFTADDIMFWYEDVFKNESLRSFRSEWLAGDNPVVVEKTDDYTVVFKFEKPNGMFLQNMASAHNGMPMVNRPRHYLKQFLKKYNPDVEQQAKEADFDSWAAMFAAKTEYWGNKDLPTLHAWVTTTPVGESTQRVIAERNPYYWKTDSEGSQLPYLDRLVYNQVTDPETLTLKMLNGEIDMSGGYSLDLQDKPVFARSRERGNYHFYETATTYMNNMMLALNLTHKNKAMREIFQNKDFRIGLSHAINRQEIIDVVHVEQGEPWQGAPRPESPFYSEEMAKQYTEHSVEKANQYLDRVLPEKNGDGMRLGPDNKPLFFQVEVSAEQTEWIDQLQLIRGYWRAVGIDMRPKVEDSDLLYTRKEANQHDAVVHSGDGGLDVLLEPRWYFPFSGESNFAIPWANWYNAGGLQGQVDRDEVEGFIMEPSAAAKQQMQLYDQLRAAPDPQQQTELMSQILEIAREQFWAMGILLTAPGYGTVKNDFHNVPDPMTSSWFWPSPGPSDPCQYWEEQQA